MDEDNTVSVSFDRDEYERLLDVTDSPADLLYEAAIRRIELEEAIAFTELAGSRARTGTPG